MVKMQAVQSALAIRRQRSRQEELKKAKLRRESNDSMLSSPRASVVSLDGRVYFDQRRESKRTCGHVTMFHVGGVLILIGLFLVITGLMPSYVKNKTVQERNDLLGTGSFFVFLGGVFTTISRFVSNNEDKELNQYIKGRLYRSRSGHRLKDAEACLSPHKERHKTSHNGISHNNHHSSPSHSSSSSHHVGHSAQHSHKNGHVHTAESKKHDGSNHNNVANHHIPKSQQDPSNGSPSVTVGVEVEVESTALPHSASSEPVLSRILEEDEEYDGDASTEPLDSSLSMSSSIETQALLEKTYSTKSGSRNSIKSSCKSIKIV